MRHPEYQYLDLLKQVLTRGDERIDRTGVGTKSIFGAMTRFDLSDGTAPILTTKRVFRKTAVKEMLWFFTGGTNIQPLVRENVRIWTDWLGRSPARRPLVFRCRANSARVTPLMRHEKCRSSAP